MASNNKRNAGKKRRYLTSTDNPCIPKSSRKRWVDVEVIPFEAEQSGAGNEDAESNSEESEGLSNEMTTTTTTATTTGNEITLRRPINGDTAGYVEQGRDEANGVERGPRGSITEPAQSVSFDEHYFSSDTEEGEADHWEQLYQTGSEDDTAEVNVGRYTHEDDANCSDVSIDDQQQPEILNDDQPDTPNEDQSDIPDDDDAFIPNADECINDKSDITKGQAIVTLIAFILRHHLTNAAVCDMLEMFDVFFPGTFPSSKFLLAKGVMNPDEYYDAHLFCPICDVYLGTFSGCERLASCQSCSTRLDRNSCLKDGHFFLYVSIEKQLRQLLRKYALAKKSDVVGQEDLSCAFSGKVLKQHFNKGDMTDNDITLIWNCDGAPVFHSSKRSVWPLQACINELPADCKDNCLLIGLWFSKQKPWTPCYFKPFIDELKYLGTAGMTWTNSLNERIQSKVYSVCSSCDSCARPMFRNTTQFNGHYGFDWCLQEGEVIERGDGTSRIYVPLRDPPEKRTLHSFSNDALQSSPSNPVHGVKGVSPLLFLPKFDIITGFVPDYLHCVLLGVVRMFTCLWFDSKHHHEPWYIGNTASELSSKLVNMKPPSNISRLPRAFSERKFWKSFLLYYSLIVLYGTLPQQFLNHWFLLVFSINILLQDRISQPDVDLAEEALKVFVSDVPVLYNREYCTFNVHQLLHLAEAVRNWGPLWVFSCFRFEGNIGHILGLVRGTKCVPHQICKTFLLQTRLQKLHEQYFSTCDLHLNSFFRRLLCSGTYVRRTSVVVDNVHLYGSCNTHELTPAEALAVSHLYGTDPSVLNCKVYNRCSYNSMYVTSLSYKQSNRNCDDTIQLQDGSIGVVLKCFVGSFMCRCFGDCNGSCEKVLLLLNAIDKSNERHLGFNQNLRISSDRFITIGNQSRITLCIEPSMMLRKCFRFQRNNTHYVIPLPTSQEMDK